MARKPRIQDEQYASQQCITPFSQHLIGQIFLPPGGKIKNRSGFDRRRHFFYRHDNASSYVNSMMRIPLHRFSIYHGGTFCGGLPPHMGTRIEGEKKRNLSI